MFCQDGPQDVPGAPEDVEQQDSGQHNADDIDPIASHNPNLSVVEPSPSASLSASPKLKARVRVTEKYEPASPSGRSVHFATTQPTVVDLELGRAAQRPQKGLFKTMFTKKAHWVSKRVMLGCFLIAIAGILGHHAFFSSLVGQPIGDQMDQQRTRLYVEK